MRLLQMCTHFEGGGISRHVIDLSNALRAQGHFVAIAGTRGKWMSEEIDAISSTLTCITLGKGEGRSRNGCSPPCALGGCFGGY